MGIGPIPFTAIVEYFRLYPVGDFEHFRYLMRCMDSAYLKETNSKSDDKKGS